MTSPYVYKERMDLISTSSRWSWAISSSILSNFQFRTGAAHKEKTHRLLINISIKPEYMDLNAIGSVLQRRPVAVQHTAVLPSTQTRTAYTIAGNQLVRGSETRRLAVWKPILHAPPDSRDNHYRQKNIPDTRQLRNVSLQQQTANSRGADSNLRYRCLLTVRTRAQEALSIPNSRP